MSRLPEWMGGYYGWGRKHLFESSEGWSSLALAVSYRRRITPEKAHYAVSLAAALWLIVYVLDGDQHILMVQIVAPAHLTCRWSHTLGRHLTSSCIPHVTELPGYLFTRMHSICEVECNLRCRDMTRAKRRTKQSQPAYQICSFRKLTINHWRLWICLFAAYWVVVVWSACSMRRYHCMCNTCEQYYATYNHFFCSSDWPISSYFLFAITYMQQVQQSPQDFDLYIFFAHIVIKKCLFLSSI
jgi:hypothetical protein